jgi:hypothetical protein
MGDGVIFSEGLKRHGNDRDRSKHEIAGAEGRFNMGLAIMTGISIGTVFTLFVVPAMYMSLATDHAKQQPAPH